MLCVQQLRHKTSVYDPLSWHAYVVVDKSKPKEGWTAGSPKGSFRAVIWAT